MARQPNIDPATGLDLDDPTNQSVIAQSQAAPLGSPAFAAQAAGFGVDPTAADQLGVGTPIQHQTPTGTAADMQRAVDEAPPLVQPPPPEAPAGPTVPSPSQAAQAAAAPPPAGPESSTSKREVEQTILSPESKASMAQGRALSARQGTDADAAATATKAKNASDTALQRDTGRADAMAADLEAKQLEYAETQHQIAQARHDEAVAKAEQRIGDAQKRVDADFETSQKSYWADKSTGFKIIATLLEGASIRDSRILGDDPNNNPVVGTIREAVAADKAKKLAQYQKSKEYLAEVKKGPEQARQALLDARADIDAATARQLQITTKKAEALKTSRKVDPARLQVLLDATNADSQAKLDESKQGMIDRELVRAAPTNRKVTATTTTTTGDKSVNSRSRGKEMEFAVYGTGVQDAIKEARAARLSPKQVAAAIAKVQQNETALKAVEQSHGVSGALGTSAGRAIGLVPLSRLDGLSPAQQKFINNLDVAAKKTSTIIAGQGHANAHEMMEAFIPRNGDSPELIEQKLQEMDAFGAKAAALGGASTKKAQRAGDAVRSAGGPPADPYAAAGVPQLRKALAAAGKAGDKAAVADLRAALAAKGEK